MNDTSHGKPRGGKNARTAGTIETNPVGLLVGALALGAIIAAIIPRGAREKELLAPVGKRVGNAAALALAAAKDAGKAELESLGLTTDAARDQAKSLFQGLAKAAATAGSAAAKAAREKENTPSA